MDPVTRDPRLRTRRIHYFSGFDPRGAAHYHRVCREESAKPQPHGGELRVGDREKAGAHVQHWTVTWQPSAAAPEGATVRTQHVFMAWDDLVRAHWTRQPLAFLRESLATSAYLFRDIGARRVWRMYRPALLAGLLPLAIVAIPPVIAGALAFAWGAAGAAAGALATLCAWALARRAGLGWLQRTLNFFRRMAFGPVDGLAARGTEWLETIVDMQRREPVDEVLLVGHSVGALVLVDTVDRLLADPRWQALQAGRTTSLLTLGQSFPMVALVPQAGAFRAALRRLCEHPGLCWWDVTARIDPLCFYRLHPLAGSGNEATDTRAGTGPVTHAARFMHMYDTAEWTRIRADKLRAHFLYLETPAKAGNFSPADVFYGPRSLAQQIHASGGPPDG